MTDPKPQSASLAWRVADVLLPAIGVLLAGHYMLGYQWPEWETALSALLLGLLILGPFVAIAFAARGENFRARRLVVAAVVGELVGILLCAGLYTFFAAHMLAGRQSRLVVFLPPPSLSDQLVTLAFIIAFIIAYALTVAATVLLARWVYARSRRSP